MKWRNILKFIKIQTKQGLCPIFGSYEPVYHGVPEHYKNEPISDYQKEEIEYVFECNNCEHLFQEVYRLEYIRT